MSTLAKIIYAETGLTQGGTPDEYEEVASACRRFALRCDPRQPLTDDAATRLVQSVVAGSDRPIGMVEFGLLVARAIERAHGIT